ncbi:uncharacterized protein LOC134747919 [Cydia strobilella]|uniref:uncharacterized protein LOC134747919 n=1 Tax=Cydia strobilella TaxID=1100964 RepID=UPI0030057FDE
MMLIIWTLLLSSISCYGVTETQEETDNVTTLYPISKNTSDHANQTDSVKTATSLAETLNNESNKIELKEEPVIEKPGNDSKEFKPSVHFQDFFDEDDFGIVSLPTKPTVDGFSPLKKPPSAFIGSHKDAFKSTKTKPPLERFPYKFQDAILTRAKPRWRPNELESRPTVPVPAQVPAGGLYKTPDAFKDKPSIDDDEEFGLTFHDEKETLVKKRANPWKSLLHLLTAFIPVGLIISALTPNVVTIHSTGSGGPGLGPGHGPGMGPGIRPMGPGVSGIEPLPPRLFRRSDEVLDPLPPPATTPPPAISEPCRRRLLCELHSEKNYHSQHSVTRRGRACHKLPCDDTDALAHTLHWLLHRPADRPDPNRFNQPQF